MPSSISVTSVAITGGFRCSKSAGSIYSFAIVAIVGPGVCLGVVNGEVGVAPDLAGACSETALMSNWFRKTSSSGVKSDP